ncbi:MAG: DUF459 domain-containing protein [Actinomycetota bacterium]|nr:MAG: DUF459 domain-containing protein [Actinomycetota bacterium]
MTTTTDPRRVRSATAVSEPASHPAFDESPARRLPAGKVIVVCIVACLTAALLGSATMVRTARGMAAGPVQSMILAVAEPIDRFAAAVWLDKPAQGLALLAGTQLDDAAGRDLLAGSDDILTPPSAPPAAPAAGKTPAVGKTPAPTASTGPVLTPVTTPSVTAPVPVLVLGDSLATYVGQQLQNLTTDAGMVDVTTVWRNGTGLTTPGYFNWQSFALDQVAKRRPKAVVLVLGGNDRTEMTKDGQPLRLGTAAWDTEYARRVAVVMASVREAGVERVYWAGPPTARDDAWDSAYAAVNTAIARAAAAVPGARYVDLYHGTAVDGRYSDTVTLDGTTLNARQADGIHWTFAAAKQPARLVLAAVADDYGRVS